jgi:crotonobetainyl-CoA:carnitine CoA-transferase CaiB-like acyl-CoA transferase
VEVIKIDHPERPDPIRELRIAGLGEPGQPLRIMYEMANRGKRSLGLDITSAEGRELFTQMVGQADVFLTNLLPSSLKRMELEVEDIRRIQPQIVYARGSGYGPRGDDADSPGFDGTAYWARGGIADSLTPADAALPTPSTPAMGDAPAGLSLAGAITAALLHRERTGHAAVVDVSLLGTAVWNAAPQIISAAWTGHAPVKARREDNSNPVSLPYRLKDGRFIKLSLFTSDLHWASLCERMGRADLVTDERFHDSAARAANNVACIRELESALGQLTIDEVISRFTGMSGAWSVVRTVEEVVDDPQVCANGYIRSVQTGHGPIPVAGTPWQFDGAAPELAAAPEHGQHTEEILLELGLDWDGLIKLKEAGIIT